MIAKPPEYTEAYALSKKVSIRMSDDKEDGTGKYWSLYSVTHILFKIQKSSCNTEQCMNFAVYVYQGYGLFSLRLIGFAMFGATFNLVTRVGLL